MIGCCSHVTLTNERTLVERRVATLPFYMRKLCSSNDALNSKNILELKCFWTCILWPAKIGKVQSVVDVVKQFLGEI